LLGGQMTTIRDLRYAVRALRKAPGFTIATVAVLAFGIGANTAIFSLVESVLLRELSYRDPARLVWNWSLRSDNRQTNFNLPDFLDYRNRNRTFDSIAAMAEIGATLTSEGEPVRLQGVRISANAFQMLGVGAAVGRPLQPDDDRPGAPAVLVASHA